MKKLRIRELGQFTYYNTEIKWRAGIQTQDSLTPNPRGALITSLYPVSLRIGLSFLLSSPVGRSIFLLSMANTSSRAQNFVPSQFLLQSLCKAPPCSVMHLLKSLSLSFLPSACH